MQHLFPPPPATHSLCGVQVDEALKQAASSSASCTKCLQRTKEIEKYVRETSNPDFKIKPNPMNVNYSLGEPEVKTVAIDMKQILIKSVKQGASAGVMKAISNRIVKKLSKSYPMIKMIPEDVQHLMVCMAVHMAASAAPEMPGIKAAEAISSQAFEGILTASTAKMVSQLVEVVGSTLEEIAAKNPELLGEVEE